MRDNKLTIKKLIKYLIIVALVLMISFISILISVPDQITVFENQEYVYNFNSFCLVSLKTDNNIIMLNNGKIKEKGKFITVSGPISMKPQKEGVENLNINFLGFIPLKRLQFNVVTDKKIVACGNTVGVKMDIKGILIIGMSDVETMDGKKVLPAKESGFKKGDIILEVNKEKTMLIDDLIKIIKNSKGKDLSFKVRHGNDIINIVVKPVRSIEDRQFHIGLWVRDSTAGIGTLTYYDPEDRSFGALGHGITDIDTDLILPVEYGEILESSILSIKKGIPGGPGELKGIFSDDSNELGIINNNCMYGIYGYLKDESIPKLPQKSYPIALRSKIQTGPATILANIDGKEVKEYNIEIQKVSKNSLNNLKGMVIKITDERLINKTGGIVQGMSGSPILQNQKIVGAVTHVLVNDPTRGYGVFIEWMLKSSINKNNEKVG